MASNENETGTSSRETGTIRNKIVDIVAALGRCGFADIQASLCRRTGRLVPTATIRIYLGRLVAEGAIERFDRGRYCVAGKAPPTVAVGDWIVGTLCRRFPDALTAKQLQKLFVAEHAYRPTEEWIENEMAALVKEEKLTKYPGGACAAITPSATPSL